MLILSIFILVVLLTLLVNTGINIATFPRVGKKKSICNMQRGRQNTPSSLPLVSILIPARNEAKTISRTIQSLASQTYPYYEVLILDDQSTDGTYTSVMRAIDGNKQFRLITGENLPEGWLGKNYACHQLSQIAAGDFLLFLDADVTLHPSTIFELIELTQSNQADLLTVWPTQITDTWAERLVVPLMAFAVMAYLPLPAVHHLPWSSFAAANGQCLLFKRQAYQQIGGHQSVRDSIIEDMDLAKRIKAAKLKLRMADGNSRVLCRMYTGVQSTIDGYTKNILAGHGDKPLTLFLSIIFHLLVFVFPWIWLITGSFHPEIRSLPVHLWPLLPLTMISLSILIRILTAAASRQRIHDACLLPISVLFMTFVANKALWLYFRKGDVSWKGRSIPSKSLTLK